MNPWLQELGDLALNLIYPAPELPSAWTRRIEAPFCERCAQPFAGALEDAFECYNCRHRQWSLAWARAAFKAEGQVREVIHGFKYEDRFYWLRQLTDWLEEGFQEYALDVQWDALIPVPLFHRRERERGFNQAKELARELGRRRQVPVWPVLRRTRETAPQAGLFRSGRLHNLRGAFAVQQGRFDLEGKNLLLIDDVFTTGATTDACARLLRGKGAALVAALTVARG